MGLQAEPPSWADRGNAVPDNLLYSLVDRDTRKNMQDFSPAIDDICSATEEAHREMKAELIAIIDCMRSPSPLPAIEYNYAKQASLAAYYMEATNRFVRLARGTLLIFVITGIRTRGEDMPALLRLSKLCEFSQTTAKRARETIQAMSESNSQEKRRNADICRRKLHLAEDRFYRKMVCVTAGANPSLDGARAMWEDATAWAVRFGSKQSIIDRMHNVLRAVLRHKRRIDWERDSTWAYEAPGEKRLPFAGDRRSPP